MYYWFRRILETLFCIFVSSLPIFGLVQMRSIPQNIGAYITVFSVCSLVYLILNIRLLKAHLMAVYETKNYLIVNLTIWFTIYILALVSIYANITGTISSGAYTAVFGFTKCIRPWTEILVGKLNLTEAKTKFISSALSLSLVMLIHLLAIIFFVVDRNAWRKDMERHGEGKLTRSPEELEAEARENIRKVQQTHFEHFNTDKLDEDI